MVSNDNNKRRRLLHREAARLALLLAALTLAELACQRGALAQPANHEREPDKDSIQLDIPSGPIGETLMEFAVQTRFSVAGDTSILKSVTTKAVSGRYSAVSALRQMLSGTGLIYELIADKSAVIRRVPARIEPSPIVGPTHMRTYQPDPQDTLVTIEGNRPGKHPPGSYTIVLDRGTIDGLSGDTIQDALRSRPDIFGGGPTEDTEKGPEARANNSKGSGINLRGLDAGATLVLLNGRRIASGGGEGGYQDVANIPISAVESIEITPEGADIRYGTDAPGGIVDLVLRDGFTGKEAEASGGVTTDGDVRQHRYSLLWGAPTHLWGNGSVTLAFEDFSRGALPASDRAQASSDLRAFHGQNFDIPFGNPGNIVVGSQIWAIPHGQNGTALPVSALVPNQPNLYDRYEGATVLPSQRRLSGVLSIDETLDNGVKLFVDALIGKRSVESSIAPVIATLSVPVNNPYYVNPTGTTDPVDVQYGFGADLGPQTLRGDVITRNFSAGAEIGLREWVLTSYAGFSSDNEDLAFFNEVNFGALDTALMTGTADGAFFNPFGDGGHSDSEVLDSIRGIQTYQARSRLGFVHTGASGPAGPLQVELGGEYRAQTFDTLVGQTGISPLPESRLRRHVSSAYAQIRMPILPDRSDRVWLSRLDATAGFRTDRYSDVGPTSNPTFGLSWSPTADITFHATWARAFRPPNLPDLVELNNVSEIVALPDKSSPTGMTQTLVWAGDNASLRPERALTWTVGANWKLPAMRLLPNAALDLTLFDVKLDQRIDSTELTDDALSNPVMIDRIVRDPSAALRAQVCSTSLYQGDPAECLSTPVGAVVDLRMRNIDVLRTRGIDLLARSVQFTPIGELRWRLEGTYLLKFSEAAGPDAPMVSVLNTATNPINVRARASATWSRRNFSVMTAVNFANGYHDTSVPPRRVDSWTTTDLTFQYTLRDPQARVKPTAQLFLKIENLFNRLPPFVNNQVQYIGYDQENGDLLGRFASLGIRVNF